MHWSGLNSDLKHLLKHIFRGGRGANLSKTKLTNKWKLWKMVRNNQSNLIASVKMLNIGVINKYTINYGMGGGYSVLFNSQSFFSNLFSLAPPPQLFFSIICIRNRLLRVSFIELFDFIIYQHLNKRRNILPLATSQVAHLFHQFNHVCTANF